MRQVLFIVSSLSLSGPFVVHWIAIGQYVIDSENGGNDGDASDPTAFDELGFWLTLMLQAYITVLEATAQIYILPKVYDWIRFAPIDPDSGIVFWD